MESVIDSLSQGSIVELLRVLIDAQYFEVLFPFLLLFALYFHVLQKILGRKGPRLFAKSTSFIIALVVSFYSVAFKFPSGYSVADLMMFVFPNISSISVAILAVYVVGSILGKDFFKGMFRKDFNTYSIYFFAALAVGSVIYYGGIVIGFWNFEPYDSSALFSVILSISFLILSVVFLIIGWFVLGSILLYTAVSFFYNQGSVSITSLLFDPYLFILFIFIGLMSWLFKSDEDVEKKINRDMRKQEKTMRNVEKNYSNNTPKDGDDLIYDAVSQGYEGNKKKLQKLSR